MRKLFWVARLELAALFSAPVVYVIGALFLVVQGASFASLMAAMADPKQPAALGAVLEAQLGGTVLSWSLWAMVLSLLGMRAIAEARKSGEWEALLTAGVSERAAVIGKWLALSLLLGLLWLPTTAYLIVVASYQQGSAAWDLGSIAAGYLGVWAIGAAMLSLALAASAAAGQSLVAGALGYFALMVLLLLGELPSIAPELTSGAPVLERASQAVALRGHAAALARGEVTAQAVALVLALSLTGLSAAIALAARGRRRGEEVRIRGISTGLLAVAGVLAVALGGRGGASWDVSARAGNTLDDATLSVLAELKEPGTLTIIEPTLGALRPIFESAERVLARMQRRQPRLSIRRMDPVAVPGGLVEIARQAGVAAQDLASSGGLVVQVGQKRRVLDFFALAELTPGAAGPELVRWSVERQVAAKLAELLRPAPVTVCATAGQGELAVGAASDEDDPASAVGTAGASPGGSSVELAAFSRRAADDGVGFVRWADGPVPAACQVVLVAGARRPLPPERALELARFVEGGGGLVVGLASRALDERGQLPQSGLELVLSAAGIEAPAAVAIDPRGQLAGDGSLRVIEGYAEHEINRGFSRARATVWWTPRVVVARAPAAALITGGAESWGEVDLVAPPARDAADLDGPVALAAAVALDSGGRIAVMGSMESLSSSVLAGTSAHDLWMVRALRWAARRPLPEVPVADRSPDQVRLLMTRGERRSMAVLCAAGIPAAWLVLGLLAGGGRRWRRGRRDAKGAPAKRDGA